jgi:CBS domain-containing protein
MSIQAILDSKGSDVITISRNATLKNAADQMLRHGVAALIVTSGDAITGITCARSSAR